MQIIDEFIAEMHRFVPSDSRVLGCQFRGDPNADIYSKWRAKVIKNSGLIDEGANVYLCVSAMKRNAKGEFRRRKDNFAGGILLMIDDIGTGLGAKFPMSIIDALEPTCLVETSPDNYQATYFFDSLITDIEEFDALIRAFIEQQFLGNDTGQAGVNRVFRPPAGVNGKPKYGGFKVNAHSWKPELRYSIAEVADAFGLELKRRVRRQRVITKEEYVSRIDAFEHATNQLEDAGMIKQSEPDLSGWFQMVCPWTDNHTDRADNGAAIRMPDEDNGFFGGFRCHHGHCADKGWRDLTDWLDEQNAEILDKINENADGCFKFEEFNSK
jgi:hypothetical protein